MGAAASAVSWEAHWPTGPWLCLRRRCRRRRAGAIAAGGLRQRLRPRLRADPQNLEAAAAQRDWGAVPPDAPPPPTVIPNPPTHPPRCFRRSVPRAARLQMGTSSNSLRVVPVLERMTSAGVALSMLPTSLFITGGADGAQSTPPLRQSRRALQLVQRSPLPRQPAAFRPRQARCPSTLRRRPASPRRWATSRAATRRAARPSRMWTSRRKER